MMPSSRRPFALVAVALVATIYTACSSEPATESSGSDDPTPTSWEDVDARADLLAEDVTLLAAEVIDGVQLASIHERAPGQVAAIGPAISIYVLGSLTDQIASGDIAWDDELTISPEHRSVPAGPLAERADGSVLTVAEAAVAMISASDGTATELLLGAVGRDHVEYIVAPMGLGEESQARTLPLLTTRESATLKWIAGEAERDAYSNADPATRSAIAQGLHSERPTPVSIDSPSPSAVDTIGWFASADELAQAQLWIDSQRELPGQEPLAAIVTNDSGVRLDAAVWPTFSFSSGAEPGVFSLSWLLVRHDDRRFVVTMIANDRTQAVDREAALTIAEGAIALLAAT